VPSSRSWTMWSWKTLSYSVRGLMSADGIAGPRSDVSGGLLVDAVGL
jgi:hypothetical protein